MNKTVTTTSHVEFNQIAISGLGVDGVDLGVDLVVRCEDGQVENASREVNQAK